MSTIQIPWAPRAILVNRTFRLPVQAPDEHVTLEAEGFRLITSRWCAIDSAVYHYLTASNIPGDYTLRASHNRQTAEVTIQVRTLEEFRTIHQYNGATWPRRWPVGQTYQTTKTRQTLQDLNIPETLNEQAATWWIEQTDETVWQQLPPSELPKAHYTNVHHGCPNCGTAIYRYGGFYPWSRNHLPCDFKSTCPNCNAVFPSNSLTSQDYTSGQFPDDGYGYFDKDEHIFIFAASYHRDQCRTFGSGIDTLTAYLRKNGPNEQVARRLGLMLLRYAQEECYVASAPQFRFGAQIG
ncbi:MAG: hypothetical protein O2954_14585, partial [bacterium]|nr:hypothetical protein [bacterium]